MWRAAAAHLPVCRLLRKQREVHTTCTHHITTKLRMHCAPDGMSEGSHSLHLQRCVASRHSAVTGRGPPAYTRQQHKQGLCRGARGARALHTSHAPTHHPLRQAPRIGAGSAPQDGAHTHALAHTAGPRDRVRLLAAAFHGTAPPSFHSTSYGTAPPSFHGTPSTLAPRHATRRTCARLGSRALCRRTPELWVRRVQHGLSKPPRHLFHGSLQLLLFLEDRLDLGAADRTAVLHVGAVAQRARTPGAEDPAGGAQPSRG